MRSGHIALTALLALCAGPAVLAAQTVRGTVTDPDYHRPVTGAVVVLMDTLSAPVDSTRTDSAGAFVLAAPGPGPYIIHVTRTGYLSWSGRLELPAGAVDRAIEMPLISTRAARVMGEVIRREAAFDLPWEELCGEPVRPWEAGVLVGVARRRADMEPVPRAVVRAEPVANNTDQPADTGAWPRSTVATATGSFWFCNLPVGRVRVVARADGFRPDTSYATIRAGTISWYDALLR